MTKEQALEVLEEVAENVKYLLCYYNGTRRGVSINR